VVRFPIAAVALLATAGPASSQFVGNTLQASLDMRLMICAAGGGCDSKPLPLRGLNIYVPNRRTAFIDGARTGEVPLGRWIAAEKGARYGFFLAGDRLDFKITVAGVVVGLSFRAAGKGCTIAGIAGSSAERAVLVSATPKYCRIVPGRAAG
jgi:hypothetical protein